MIGKFAIRDVEFGKTFHFDSWDELVKFVKKVEYHEMLDKEFEDEISQENE